MTAAFVIDATDNVATLLGDAEDGVTLRGAAGDAAAPLALSAPVALGHKVALRAIAPGEAVVKFGVPIGIANGAIAAGDWVHLHNCRSRFDTRSGSFDPVTGAAQDTHYA